jgi:hypothetical protein
VVTQYLTIIQPFRHFLQDQAQIPSDGVGDYLWADSAAPWTEDTLTQALVQQGRHLLGRHIHLRAWRQIMIRIACHKLAPAEASLLIGATKEPEGEDGEVDATPAGSMLNALHWQASHTPHTGNRVYRGTVNFRGGLTNAGLQEYRHVSMLWHRLIRDPLHFTMTGATPMLASQLRGADDVGLDLDLHGPTPWEWDTPTPTRRRGAGAGSNGDMHPVQPLMIMPAKRPRVQQQQQQQHEDGDREREEGRLAEGTPLVRRVAWRRAPARARRWWPMAEATLILERMYGAGACYRTQQQQRAIEHILAGHGQVVAILRTSKGKSLLYLLPCQLPGAGTTIVILPLLVLRDEMRRRSTKAGIHAHVWGPTTQSHALHSCPLIFVTVEQAVHNTTFREFLYRLHIANQLDRVVFDECHLAVTALSYRRAMALLPQLRELQVQTIFLTGTLPPVLVPEFQKHMLLDGARFIRGPTTDGIYILGCTTARLARPISRTLPCLDFAAPSPPWSQVSGGLSTICGRPSPRRSLWL